MINWIFIILLFIAEYITALLLTFQMGLDDLLTSITSFPRVIGFSLAVFYGLIWVSFYFVQTLLASEAYHGVIGKIGLLTIIAGFITASVITIIKKFKQPDPEIIPQTDEYKEVFNKE